MVRNTPATQKRLRTTRYILAIILPCIAGGVNVSGLLSVGMYTSHMTGHVSRLGSELAQGVVETTLTELSFVVCFILGVMLSTSCVALARVRPKARHAVPLLLETALLAAYSLWPGPLSDVNHRAVLSCMLCLAMGIQNALVTQAFGATMRTTHLTGICTDLGIEITRLVFWVQAFMEYQTDKSINLWQELIAEPEWAQLRTHFSVLMSYFVGAVAGAYSYVRFGRNAVGMFCVVLLLLTVYDMKEGIKRLDL